MVRDHTLSPDETAVPLSLDFPGMFEHVLAVLPATRRVVVIIGELAPVHFDRAYGQPQIRGNLLHPLPLDDQAQDVALSERCRSVSWGAGRLPGSAIRSMTPRVSAGVRYTRPCSAC